VSGQTGRSVTKVLIAFQSFMRSSLALCCVASRALEPAFAIAAQVNCGRPFFTTIFGDESK
jgi:hypothetical protein